MYNCFLQQYNFRKLFSKLSNFSVYNYKTCEITALTNSMLFPDSVSHQLFLAWQVLVGGRVVQHVRSPHRTKALVTGLPLAGSFTIGLVAVADDGRCSTPVIVTQDRSRLYPNRNIAGHTMRRVIPTSL